MIFHELNLHPTPKAAAPARATGDASKIVRRTVTPHETAPTEEVELQEPATAPLEDEQAVSGLTKSSDSANRVTYDRASQKEAAVKKAQRERKATQSTEPLPTPEEAIVKLAVAKNRIARMDARASVPVAAEELAAARLATEELAERGVLHEAAADLRADEFALAERDNISAYRNSVSNLSESEAGDETGALDTEIGKAVLAGNTKLVENLEAKKAAIQDAQIAIATRKVAAEREAAFQRAQQQIAIQRTKESEKSQKINQQRQLEQKVKAHAQHAQQEAATSEHRAAAQRALASQFERRLASNREVHHEQIIHVDQDIAAAKQGLHFERSDIGTVHHPVEHHKVSAEELLLLEEALAKQGALVAPAT